MTTTNVPTGLAGTASDTADARAAALGLRISSTLIGGARTTYVDEGSGPVMLLLHGALMSSLGFVRVIRELCVPEEELGKSSTDRHPACARSDNRVSVHLPRLS